MNNFMFHSFNKICFVKTCRLFLSEPLWSIYQSTLNMFGSEVYTARLYSAVTVVTADVMSVTTASSCLYSLVDHKPSSFKKLTASYCTVSEGADAVRLSQ